MELIVLNHKMNLLKSDIESYQAELKKIKLNNITLIVCPSNIYLTSFLKKGFKTGSQNVACFENGPHTGEVSAEQLKSIGVRYALVGHSERREEFQEDKTINAKLNMLLKNDIRPILCIGEKKEEKEHQDTKQVITKQLKDAFEQLPAIKRSKIMVAYEPVWAIGSGETPTLEEIDEICFYIKNYLKDHYAICPKVLYGGSVNDENVENFRYLKEVDGFLLGGISLKPSKLNRLIEKVK